MATTNRPSCTSSPCCTIPSTARRTLAAVVGLLGVYPACAGEPSWPTRSTPTATVYPRACGGTETAWGRDRFLEGLSPRVRGNPAREYLEVLTERSIPARAGEPPIPRPSKTKWSVYPRACGGTSTCAAHSPGTKGLSPRVRGNHRCRYRGRVSARSIPARAGEPMEGWTRGRPAWVYPRACGGTTEVASAATVLNGLSPRVRGNPEHRQAGPDTGRSIPARAGEPLRRKAGQYRPEVYPRACGGTSGRLSLVEDEAGLSPRVRGNLVFANPLNPFPRSIPARAGEPTGWPFTWAMEGVYPRACGGTPCGGCLHPGCRGLSPRVRGNLGAGVVDGLEEGSIPARAGEPRGRRR